MLVAAWVMVALHVALIAFVLSGSLLALRRPSLLWLHAPVALLVLAVNVAGAPCPLTVWELDLRAAAGVPGYEDGFIDHYLLEPFGAPDVHTPAAQVGIYTVALVPNLVGYGLHAARAVRRRALRPDPRSPRDRHPARVGAWASARRRSGRRWPSTTARWPAGTCATSSPRTPRAASGSPAGPVTSTSTTRRTG